MKTINTLSFNGKYKSSRTLSTAYSVNSLAHGFESVFVRSVQVKSTGCHATQAARVLNDLILAFGARKLNHMNVIAVV